MSFNERDQSRSGPRSSANEAEKSRHQGIDAMPKSRAVRSGISATFLLEASAHLDRLFPDANPARGSSPDEPPAGSHLNQEPAEWSVAEALAELVLVEP